MGTSLINPFWKILWKLDVPAKVKKICWRNMHGILPLKAILLKRHIGTSGVCPLCQSDEEDILHMVFKCPGAENVWRVLDLEDTINQAMTMDRSGSQVLEAILKTPRSLPGYDFIKVHNVVAIAVHLVVVSKTGPRRADPSICTLHKFNKDYSG
jgi:hypothetical protein